MIVQYGDTIYVEQEGSRTAPVRLSDLALLAPGVRKTGEDQYRIDAEIRLDRSHLLFAGEQIEIEGARANDAEHRIVEIGLGSSFQVGRVDANGVSYDGCSISITNAPLYLWSAHGNAGDFASYGSLWRVRKREGAPWSFWRLYPDNPDDARVEIHDCIFDGGAGIGRVQNASVQRNVFLRCTDSPYGPIGTKGPCVLRDNAVHGSPQCAYWSPYHSGDSRIERLVSRANEHDLSCGSPRYDAVLTLVDCELADPIRFALNAPSAKSQVHEQYTFAARVVDDYLDTPIEGALLHIVNVLGEVVVSAMSDSNGSWGGIELHRAIYTSATPKYQTPHRIIVRKYGYVFVDEPLTVSAPNAKEFRLRRDVVTTHERGVFDHVDIDLEAHRITVRDRNSTVEQIYDALHHTQALDGSLADRVRRDGSVVNLGDWNLTVDACELVGAVKTTGIVTFERAARATGYVEDANGISTVWRM